jgi:hypothetical protein
MKKHIALSVVTTMLGISVGYGVRCYQAFSSEGFSAKENTVEMSKFYNDLGKYYPSKKTVEPEIGSKDAESRSIQQKMIYLEYLRHVGMSNTQIAEAASTLDKDAKTGTDCYNIIVERLDFAEENVQRALKSNQISLQYTVTISGYIGTAKRELEIMKLGYYYSWGEKKKY